MAKDDDISEKRISKVQTSLTKLFDCPVCFERITPPVLVCVNGHAVCHSCRKHLQTCPTCKASFSLNKNTMLDQILEESTFACKYSEKGCWVEMKFRELEEHEQKYCRFRTIICKVQENPDKPCNSEIPVCAYYNHVAHEHSAEILQFNLENHRILDVSAKIDKINILKDVHTGKIVFEIIKLDKVLEKFYITYQYVGNCEDANKYFYELRIYHNRFKHKELKFKTLCVPLGLSDQEKETSERCLVINTCVLNNFRNEDRLFYSVKIEPVSQKWYQVVKTKWKGLCVRQNPSNETKTVEKKI